MRMRSSLLAIAVLLGGAQAAHAQAPNCKSVQFSDAVLERFPHVREACLDVIERQGELLAVFKADLLRVSGSKARIRAKLPDGTHAPAQTVRLHPDRRVLVDGKAYRASELALGQELTIYAQVDEPVAALAPADTAEPVEFAPIESDPVRVTSAEPQMPRTASLLPLIGLSGALLMCLAAVLGAVRRVRGAASILPT